MASLGSVESLPVFRARAIQMGLTEFVVDAFAARNTATFGSFAFSCSFRPDSPDESVFIDMIKDALQRDPTYGELSGLRRLFFESHAVSMQDMRNRIEKPTDAAPARVMPAERAARYTDQVARLSGIRLVGPLEPSNQLIDMVFALVEENQLKYIPLQSLTSREQELMGEKEDSELKEFAVRMKAGSLAVQEKPNELKADLTSDLKVRFALQRRALAFDQAALITFALHDDWISVLFHRMSESPPSGYLHVSMEQVLRADKKLFVKMAEDCRSNVVAVPGQPRPLDAAMKKYMDHNDVMYLLAPLQGSKPNSSSWVPPAATVLEPRSAPYATPKAKSKGKGKGAGKGGRGKGVKGKSKRSDYVPATAPPGCVGKTVDGRFICFNYNRPGGCSSNTLVGSSCNKGFHICGRTGCHGDHASFDCPNHVQ